MTATHLLVTRSEEPALFSIRILLWLEFLFQSGEAIGMLSCWQCIELDSDNVHRDAAKAMHAEKAARPTAAFATYYYHLVCQR